MKKKIVLWTVIFCLLVTVNSFGQQSAQNAESKKYRAICTAVGVGGGFALGLAAGMAAFDDAIASDRKSWMTALIGGIGGGIGGYFLGRHLDRRAAKTSWNYRPDPLDLSLIRSRLPEESLFSSSPIRTERIDNRGPFELQIHR